MQAIIHRKQDAACPGLLAILILTNKSIPNIFDFSKSKMAINMAVIKSSTWGHFSLAQSDIMCDHYF